MSVIKELGHPEQLPCNFTFTIKVLNTKDFMNNAKSFTVDNNLLELTLGDDVFSKSPDVSTHVLRGSGVKTPNGYIYNVDFKDIEMGKPAPPPVEVFNENDGDGTVPNRSLARALVWRDDLLENKYNFTY